MNNEKIPEMQPFSARLRELRSKKKVTQTKMANMLGCTPNHYQKIEYGKINISATVLMLLADYFGVTTDYLLGRTEL